MQTNSFFIKCTEVEWPGADEKPFSFSIARLDLLHPVISGNKLFKLHYNIEKAKQQGLQGILTMGGAYSNHLAATAFACKAEGLQSAGIIRGEIIEPLNGTLSFCKEQQMQLTPVERNQYNRNSETVTAIRKNAANFLFVPEGGDNEDGLKGCTEILPAIESVDSFTHILCCIGTGTTFKGIVSSAKSHQTIVGIPVLKIKAEEQEGFLQQHLSPVATSKQMILFNYAGDGYGKYNSSQLQFMNLFYSHTSVATDIVYSGKLIQAVIDLFNRRFFPAESKVLVLHTGGLQGNRSLPAGSLLF